ncbi:trafficking protein particle complex 1 [Thecamonas trahens ATCC 50062]|uniref:Trafficking protein particle complex subunit n=1 Tax=Thecamonas trahens ATCC 50062 TaxID=461836 RepID=A0A0L0DW95_THETB|nr:trafficking protein particle complex 1 [Thecamonas trahens ATCC 50062]KNC56356.1 trafficking protein particle complex 1 [Thecamonas trahens ATCC 50062]|eukprot:XP_013760873.1 trafficking protein particle complex 1 [Thecamonas trahens ATCC 50062]
MPVYTLFIFDRKGTCLYYTDWGRSRPPTHNDPEQEQKLLYGLLFSMKMFMKQISPDDSGDFRYLRTSAFKLHFFGTLSGLRFALFTHPSAANQSEALEHLYAEVYVPYVAKNPLVEKGEVITNEAFVEAVDDYITSLPVFAE